MNWQTLEEHIIEKKPLKRDSSNCFLSPTLFNNFIDDMQYKTNGDKKGRWLAELI